jgi:hypothetical protein
MTSNLNSTLRLRSRALALLICGLLTGAGAVSLGAFQIAARGEQNLNLQTGLTELPQGGTATDSKNGLTLTGRTLSYLPGTSLQATGVQIRTADGGTLSADTARYDVSSGVLKASGHLKYDSSAIQGLVADSVSLYTTSGAVLASGRVRAISPALSASRVVALGGGKQVLLSGNYQLTVGGSRYANPGPAATLLLTNSSSGTSATARPTPSALRPFLPFLK